MRDEFAAQAGALRAEGKRMNPAATYAAHSLPHVPRLLGMLDRQPSSLSFGSFDREHWAWKFRDFPLGMLQLGTYPLALLWRHRLEGSDYHQNARLLECICGALDHTIRRQHRNGSFDAVVPNEQNAAVTIAVAFGMAETLFLAHDAVSPARKQVILKSMDRAMDFAVARREPETHAFISNHWGLIALSYLDAHRLLGREDCLRHARLCIERILQHQSAEGWYEEYNGPDPGYETLGIHYLALYWQRTRDAEVLASLSRSVNFAQHFVHNDGSVGGAYGSRNTSLYFPAGFEILKSELPAAASIASFMRERLGSGNVVTPAVAEPQNLAPLLTSYLLAAQCPADSRPAAELPCHNLRGVHHYPRSSLVVAGTQRYYGVASLAKGGVCAVFDRAAERLAYCDAGYSARSGRAQWVTQRMVEPRMSVSAHQRTTISAGPCTEWKQVLPSPVNFLALRILNLTWFRVPAVAAFVRDWIVHRLILKVTAAPLNFCRRIRWSEDAVSFEDSFEMNSPAVVEALTIEQSFSALHMGSAKYFAASHLLPVPLPDCTDLANELNRRKKAQLEFSISWACGSAPILTRGFDAAVAAELAVCAR